MKKIKKLRLRARIKRSVSAVCMLLFFGSMFLTTPTTTILGVFLLATAGYLLVSAAYDIRRLKKIEEKRNICYSKMLVFSEL